MKFLHAAALGVILTVAGSPALRTKWRRLLPGQCAASRSVFWLWS